jgi:hypothetical protein
MPINTLYVILGLALLVSMTIFAIALRAASRGSKSDRPRKLNDEQHKKNSHVHVQHSSGFKLNFSINPHVEYHKYKIPPHVNELIKEGREDEAVAEISKITGLNEEQSSRLVNQLSGGGANISAKANINNSSFTLSKEVVEMIKQGKQDEAIARFRDESGLSAEQCKAIVIKVKAAFRS